MSPRTSYRRLNDRAARHVAALPSTDPLARANRLLDEAVAAQDRGDFAAAGRLEDEAEQLLNEAAA